MLALYDSLSLFLSLSLPLSLSAGKALFPGTSTMNQIDRIMTCVPRPSSSDVESLRSPYAQSILDQVLRKYAKGKNPSENLITILNGPFFTTISWGEK